MNIRKTIIEKLYELLQKTDSLVGFKAALLEAKTQYYQWKARQVLRNSIDNLAGKQSDDNTDYSSLMGEVENLFDMLDFIVMELEAS